MSRKKSEDTLSEMRQTVLKHVEDNYRSAEDFCWSTGLNKATVSNFLRAKKDFRVSTLESIAAACGASVSIRLEKPGK